MFGLVKKSTHTAVVKQLEELKTTLAVTRNEATKEQRALKQKLADTAERQKGAEMALDTEREMMQELQAKYDSLQSEYRKKCDMVQNAESMVIKLTENINKLEAEHKEALSQIADSYISPEVMACECGTCDCPTQIDTEAVSEVVVEPEYTPEPIAEDVEPKPTPKPKSKKRKR